MQVSSTNLFPQERRIFKPAQLNALAKDLLESNFSQIWLEGEISNLSRPASGHLYFTLKDSHAQVRCAMFRSKAMYVNTPLKDGQLVLVRARVTLYEARGDYQLAVESLQPAGQGALQLAFEQLKTKLQAEGLFALENKKTLPRFIKRLALITSPRGAAIHDVLSVLARRFPLLPIELWPVPVQGTEAAPALLHALQGVIDCGRYDAVLITRGGGSLEDLWPFNDEALVRLVATSPVPVVSAIGHEVDFSLLDFAADLRAPTPSVAAELLSPSAQDLSHRLDQQQAKLFRSINAKIQTLAQKADLAALRLQSNKPLQRLIIGKQTLQQLQMRLHSTLNHQLNARLARLKTAGSSLNALSPLATLSRGYSIIRDQNQHIIHSTQQAKPGDALTALLSDGTLKLEVKP